MLCSVPLIVCVGARLAAQSLEETVEEDEAFAQAGKAASDLFGLYINPVPRAGVAPEQLQGADALTATLAYMHASLLKFGSR